MVRNGKVWSPGPARKRKIALSEKGKSDREGSALGKRGGTAKTQEMRERGGVNVMDSQKNRHDTRIAINGEKF